MMEMNKPTVNEFEEKAKHIAPINDIADPILPFFQAYFDLLIAHATYVKQHESKKEDA